MSPSLKLAEVLAGLLPSSTPGLFNPYRDACPHDGVHNGPKARLRRLAQHLDCQPRLILIGEAPGYQGARYSGVAFTSERLLLQGAIPRVERATSRLSTRRLPFSEPSATIVWKALYEHGLAETTVMWNALQLHPVGAAGAWSNRTPTPAEIDTGVPALRRLLLAFPGVAIVAVGQKARASLESMAVTVTTVVRHPANGGAREFNEGLARIADGVTASGGLE